MDDLISRQALLAEYDRLHVEEPGRARKMIEDAPSAQPERLTDDDFETIRIHLNAYKEKLCNQHRWKEAEKYQRIIDRFMTFASAQPERKTGKWSVYDRHTIPYQYICSECGAYHRARYDFCPTCGAEMRGETDGR